MEEKLDRDKQVIPLNAEMKINFFQMSIIMDGEFWLFMPEFFKRFPMSPSAFRIFSSSVHAPN